MDGKANEKLPAGVYRSEGPNRLQVFLVGDRIVHFLNEREIDSATAVWPSGTAGVLSAIVQTGTADVTFDDWKVWTMSADGVPGEQQAGEDAGGRAEKREAQEPVKIEN